jgi:5-formyltetrahydrofolate cyclo-ligase
MSRRPGKALLREMLLKKRQSLSRAERSQKSRVIFRSIRQHPLFQQAVRVACYYDVTPEVMTRPFLGKIIREKKLFLPRVDSLKKTLTLHRVTALKRDLKKGTYAIWEPKRGCSKMVAGQMDLIIVPGVGFDRQGNRLGRGGGYYDGLLRRSKKVYKIGICFREQLVKKVPMTRRDVPVNEVITD